MLQLVELVVDFDGKIYLMCERACELSLVSFMADDVQLFNATTNLRIKTICCILVGCVYFCHLWNGGPIKDRMGYCITLLMSSISGGGPPLGAKSAADLAREVDMFVLGDDPKWTAAELDHLGVLLVSVNSAVAGTIEECISNVLKYGISTEETTCGDGLVCRKDINAREYVGAYIGTIYHAERVPTRHDYCMALSPVQFPSGAMVELVVCGFERRKVISNAAMFNHSCGKTNVAMLPQDVVVYRHLDVRMEVQELEKTAKGKKGITQQMRSDAQEVLFSFPCVVALTSVPVKAGSPLLVSYNRPGEKDPSKDYFKPKQFADAECKPGEEVVACRCGKDGKCPKNMFFIKPTDAAL